MSAKSTDCLEPAATAVPASRYSAAELLKRCMGKQPIVLEILTKFRAQLDADLPLMAAAAEEGNMTVVGNCAHKLRGSAASIGASDLAGAISVTEQHAHANAAADVQASIPRVLATAALLIADIGEILRKGA